MRGVAVWLVVVSAVAVHATSPPASGARIAMNGRVIDRASNQPIANARVVAAKVNGAVGDYRSTTSDSRGWFRVSDLLAGSYRVHADAPGYLRSEHGRPPVASSGTPVELVEGVAAPEALIRMTATGAIAGRVTNSGRPAANVLVRALKPTYRDGQRFLTVDEYAVTDDHGDYRLFDLAPGGYVVSAIAGRAPRIDGETLVTPAIPSRANGNRTEIRTPLALDNLAAAAFEAGVAAAIYYPNTPDPASATAVEVAPGATVMSIDLSLRRSSTFHVRGRIDTRDIPGAPRVRISVSPAESGTAAPIPAIEATAGEFDLPNVPPGRYHLGVQLMPAPGERSSALVITRVPLEVWDRDLDGVVALLQPGVTVSGRVWLDGSAPSSLPSIQLQGLNGIPGTSARRIDADGRFAIPNVAIGDYRWRLIPAGGTAGTPLWPKSARFGADDASKRFISVGTDAATRSLEIDLSSRTSVLEALVTDSRQRPLAGVLVVAVPDTSRRHLSDAYRSAVTSVDGRVKFEGMPPGDYLLFATETVAAEAWQDPAVLKRHEGKGRPLTLGEASRVVVVFTVTS